MTARDYSFNLTTAGDHSFSFIILTIYGGVTLIVALIVRKVVVLDWKREGPLIAVKDVKNGNTSEVLVTTIISVGDAVAVTVANSILVKSVVLMLRIGMTVPVKMVDVRESVPVNGVTVAANVVSVSVIDRERVVLSVKEVVGEGVETMTVPVKLNEMKLSIKACVSVLEKDIVTLSTLVNTSVAVSCELLIVIVLEVVVDVRKNVLTVVTVKVVPVANVDVDDTVVSMMFVIVYITVFN